MAERAEQGLRVERVKAFLAEIRALSPADLQAVTVTLQATLGSSTTSNTNDYRAPGDMDFVWFQIHGYLRFSTLNSENTAILSWLNLVPSERWPVKTQNCTVALENFDRKHKFIDNNDITLSAITPPTGYPIVYPPEAPGILPKHELLRATFTLQDTTSQIVSGNTVYGIALTGALVPREG